MTTEDRDPMMEGFGAVLKGFGWFLGFVGFGLMFYFGNSVIGC